MKPVSNAVAFSLLIPELMKAGREVGYALCVHGSMARDLDVVAVPWTEDAQSAERLVIHIAAALGGHFRNSSRKIEGTDEWEQVPAAEPTVKPHGRLSWVIWVADRLYIDLSVMPRQSA